MTLTVKLTPLVWRGVLIPYTHFLGREGAVPATAAITLHMLDKCPSAEPHPQHPTMSGLCQIQGRIHKRLLACPMASLFHDPK